MKDKCILITGAAGFIGYHLVKSLIEFKVKVVGIDNINSYYNENLKFDRLTDIGIEKNEIEWHRKIVSKLYPHFHFVRMNLEDSNELFELCQVEKFDYIVHLAAQAGVRYSVENPSVYVQSNLVGFSNILEIARNFRIKHLIFASSSSVYGLNKKIPFSTIDNVDYPISFYAATKKANELMAHSYSHLFDIPTTGLRFFTVYGPWGRPDMAYFNFSLNILRNKEIVVYNNGNMKRDFTFISDIIDGILETIKTPPTTKHNNLNKITNSSAPYRILNLGNNKPVKLLDFINILEDKLGKKAKIKFGDLKNGDVLETWADINTTKKEIKFNPRVEIKEGLMLFSNWIREYLKE